MIHRDDEDRVPSPAEQFHGLPLLEPPPVHRLAKAKGPETSRQAAVDAQDSIVRQHQALVLTSLRRGPRIGMTSKEIARWILEHRAFKIDSVQVTRRVWELRARGLVMTLDGKALELPEPGHSPHSETRDRCHVIVLTRYHQDAVAFYQQRALAERMTA